MKVQNMTSSRGNKIANQFIITDLVVSDVSDGFKKTETFQSYNSTIVTKEYVENSFGENQVAVYLDSTYWDYSVTTGKYRNQFLGETKKETQAKIDSGEYILTNLN